MLLTKNTFRETCLKKIKSTPMHNKLYRDSIVNKALLRILKKHKYKSILFYYPMPLEVDIKKVLFHIRKQKNVYIPFMENKSFKMVRYRLPLIKKQFGIFEAGNSIQKINKVDIAVVPILGVDKNLQRIGFGKGMYDRFFAKLKTKPYTIFIQTNFCYTDTNVCDEHDISCDILLTPKKILYKK